MDSNWLHSRSYSNSNVVLSHKGQKDKVLGYRKDFMIPNDLKLYHYWRSSCSWRVRWALNIKKIPYKSIAVNILDGEQKTADFRQRSSMSLVPALQIGEETFAESLAMIE